MRSLETVCGNSRGAGIPDLLVEWTLVRLRGRLSANSEMAPVVTVFFKRDAGAAAPRAGFANVSSLFALLSLLTRRSELMVLDDRDVFIIDRLLLLDEVVLQREDGKRPRSGAPVLGSAALVVVPFSMIMSVCCRFSRGNK